MSPQATWSFERVAGPFAFTEGPVWDGEAVLFADIPNSRIMCYTPVTGGCTVFRTGTQKANGLTLDREGRLYAAQGGGRRVVRYERDGSETVLADSYQGKRLNSPNDIVVDDQGRVWFTDPRYGDRTGLELGHESIFRLDPQPDGAWTITRVTFDTTRPNGLAFSPDGRTLYVAESPPAPEGPRQLRAYPVHPDATLGQPAVLYDFGPHRGIDGMRVDADSAIVASCGWAQSGPGPRIAVFAPGGAVLEEHPVPSNPTNCAFGDADLRTLYVTAYDGALYCARTSRRGRGRSW
ncbi:MAG: SMP-30/gluconolactonase/LRE family protein [Chloroflexi bacterium]|nr:SMP-30/gluconolactonase/LRE family protein [Chloroflexota bacterium]